MNAHAKINFDRDYWVVFTPSNPHDAAVYMTEDEARETIRDYPEYTCVKFNPVEGWSLPMNDEFEEMAASDAGLARSLARHERSFGRP